MRSRVTVASWGRDHRLLDLAQELLSHRVRQTQVGKIAEITRAVDLQHVDAARRPLDPALHQTQYPPHC